MKKTVVAGFPFFIVMALASFISLFGLPGVQEVWTFSGYLELQKFGLS